jgi:hypothetical protein
MVTLGPATCSESAGVDSRPGTARRTSAIPNPSRPRPRPDAARVAPPGAARRSRRHARLRHKRLESPRGIWLDPCAWGATAAARPAKPLARRQSAAPHRRKSAPFAGLVGSCASAIGCPAVSTLSANAALSGSGTRHDARVDPQPAAKDNADCGPGRDAPTAAPGKRTECASRRSVTLDELLRAPAITGYMGISRQESAVIRQNDHDCQPNAEL